MVMDPHLEEVNPLVSCVLITETFFMHQISNPSFSNLCNAGNLEYDEWSHHRQAWKLESAAIIEPPINFIVSSHSKGKRR